jgi:spermidine/putrescine transport system permease protein
MNNLFITAFFLFLYIPIIVLVVFSFNKEPFPAPWVGFTWYWYEQLYYASFLWQSLANSFIVAGTTVVLSLSMGLLLIVYDLLGGNVGRWISFFYTNLIVPEIVLAVALLSFFIMSGVPLGFTTLIIAHTILGVGYAVPIMYSRYTELDRKLIEASLDLGATQIQTFYRIIIPLIKPGIMAGALMVFVISFDDFVLAYFCAGASSQTFPLYILSVLRAGISPVVNAMATILLGISTLFVVIYAWVTRIRLFEL